MLFHYPELNWTLKKGKANQGLRSPRTVTEVRSIVGIASYLRLQEIYSGFFCNYKTYDRTDQEKREV